MANTIQHVKNGQYLQKIDDNIFDKIHFETNDGQVKTTTAITIGGQSYSAGTSLATIISALNASGGFQYKLIDTGTLSANGGMLLNLAYSTDNGSTWNEISSDPIVITDAEHATTANSATSADYATSAGSATNANYATSAGSATNATNATNVALTATGSGTATITVKAGNATGATFTVNGVASATKATQDASGNTITTTYATKTELANLESGLTQAYVTNSTAISSGPFMSLIKDKSSAQQTASIGPIAPNTALPLLNNASVKVSELKVGDTVYITEESKCDWFLGLKSQTGSNVWQLVFYSIEADSPSLTGYVTGSGLTANKIVLGNGDSKVKASTYGITTTSSTNTDTDILTSKATQSAISTALGNHSGIDKVGTVTSVGISNGGGLAVSNSPVTSSGTITVSHAVPSGASATTLGSSTSRYYIKTITTDAYGHVTGVTTGNETVTNSNTWRSIKVGGSEKLATGTGTGAVDFVDGAGIAATWTASGSKISFNLKTSGVTTGTYSAVEVDSYGRVTAGAQMIIFDTEANFASGNYDHLAQYGVLITTGA